MEQTLIFDYNQYHKFADFNEHERTYVSYLAGTLAQQSSKQSAGESPLVKEIQKARDQIKSSLNDPSVSAQGDSAKIDKLEKSNADLTKLVDTLVKRVSQLEIQVKSLQQQKSQSSPASAPAPNKEVNGGDDDEDIDLFGSDSEDDGSADRIRQERVDAYAAKKTKKPAVVAKSSIVLDVKPWDDETDMAEMEKLVRTVQTDGLVWGQAKLVPVGYGIKKLQIGCVVEDEKVGTDFLEEEITKFEDLVQSVDIAAFNKI